MSIAKEGLRFILIAAALAAVSWALGWWPAAVFFLVLALAFLF
jgi:hypothetical protein